MTFYCKDPGSVDIDDCAAFYQTDRCSWIVQGKQRGDAVAAQLRALALDETFVEIPEPLVELLVHRYVKERYGTDLDRAAG
ncbi:hypothetical protein I6A60_33830 [Frankia sp. AgB1.9]|uniref:hypothetical protein n=1 Tax=unclassified Frankia TaxID=2632575 RepID=UPI00193368DC|nr:MULTISPECIES: hypothetical protein [unclassified Frankia]MBL7552801.1 hypothetical protein [Frankia sp. AgB1.9]